VVLDGLNFPNGVITWRDGILVTAAPDILFASGTDGNPEATHKETLYTGFGEGNLQLRVNGLRWGLDNWIHCANGWSGGRPRSTRNGAPVDLEGRDLRIRPDDGLIETESGQSEYGRNCDDWGDWFGCDNSYPLFHFVLEERYMRRNPYVPAPAAKVQTYLPANPKVYPVSVGQKRYHSFDQAGHFTSACSTDFYRDNLLFNNTDHLHALVCEPVHNLVQHLLVNEDGVTFKSCRAGAENAPEFLASEDQWFRPVMARMGPDGAIWVVDMYRYMIEHPEWLPPEGRKELAP
jgi:putative membrane-bound dehydrogenase-like protein